MIIHEDTSQGMIDAIKLSQRAMVFLSVAWSGPAMIACADFRQAVRRLAEIGLEFEAFIVDEESDSCQMWLASLGQLITFENVGVVQGSGSVLWLEFGNVVGKVNNGFEIRKIEMIAYSQTLWQHETD